MCLDIINGPIEAKEDITVYKHAMLIDNVIVTSYQRVPIKFNELITSGIYITPNYEINQALHSFSNIEDAFYDSEEEASDMIIECIIPKGSTYYEGGFYGLDAIASDQMIYKKIVRLISDEAENAREKLKKYML